MERIVLASQTPTITSGSAYSTGQSIGGLLTFSGIVNGGYSAIYSVTICDKSGQNAACDLVLFSDPITATADKSSVSISSADLLKAIGVVSFVSGDYVSCGTGSVAAKAGANPGKAGLFIGAIGGTDNNIYGQLISRGTPNYSSTSDITVKITAELGRGNV